MNTLSVTPLSKGLAMVAAYREARLRQRPALRTSLHHSHAARRAARTCGQTETEPDPPPPAEISPAMAEPVSVPEPAGPISVFANLVQIANNQAPEVDESVASAPETQAPPGYDPPLAEIGFGPGMLIRLSQLGLYTTADLARADAARLRTELGEISRLVDVEAWIRSARHNSNVVAE
jgi:predicted flap endonuclease-1-like 5' DNA nuclease